MLREPSLPNAEQPTDQRKEREIARYSYPYYDLDMAVDVARVLHDQAGGKATLAQLASYIGHKDESSGAFRAKLWGAKLFGLVAIEAGVVSVTRLGEELASSRAGLQRDRRLAEAFLNVPLFSEIHRRYESTTLPSTRDGLKQALQNVFGVPQNGVTTALKSFEASAEQAGFKRRDPNRLIHPVPIGLAEEPLRTVGEGTTACTSGMLQGEQTPKADVLEGTHPALTGFLLELPAKGHRWTDGERQRWIDAFTSIIKALYPTQNEE
ncbi:MAG: hypothetical protein ACYC1C_14440 [Chloroflexota bacterium]